jgi:ferredoxin-NADP reductase
MVAAVPRRVIGLARRLAAKSAIRSDLGRHLARRIDRATTYVSTSVPLVEAALARLDPTLSLSAVRAEVVDVVNETPDTNTFWLRPNARFGTFCPGSHVQVRVRIGGRIVERSYSISSAPRSDGWIALTVKRTPAGLVSNWLADTLRAGDVVELSRATGQFVLPARLPQRLLMISAGSGITPVMSMLRQLVADRAGVQVDFLHFARSPRDIIFREELARIASARDNVHVELCVESVAGSDGAWTGAVGRVSEELLAAAAPDFRALDTYLCGPPAFMRAVVQILERCGADLTKLRYERFTTDFDASGFLEHAQLLRFMRSGTERITNRPRTILEEAESAGIPITSGCRAGNCGTCRCRKRRGVVVDVTTGLATGSGEEFIFPCVSVARGTVELDL